MRWPWPKSCFYWFHVMLKHLQHSVWHPSAGPYTARTAWKCSCGSLDWQEPHTFPIPSSWKSHWCIQLGKVSSMLFGSLIELNGTSPLLAHAHWLSGPLIQPCPAAPAFSTSRQQVGINLWVCMHAAELQGTCVSASKTPSPHTLVKIRFTVGRMMLSGIEALVMWRSPWHFHLPGAVLTFPNISKPHSWLHSLPGFTWIPPALAHVASSCHTIRMLTLVYAS